MLKTVSGAAVVGAQFDLLREPWIVVRDLAGATRELGLLECLRDAHALGEVADPSPLVTCGSYRLLLAVLQAYLPLADEDAWAEAWERGRFDDGLLDRVQASCAGRLDLFHATHPFYQSGDIPLPEPGRRAKSAETKTAGYLFPEVSTGTNIVHFSHPGDNEHAFCPACCARGLVTLAPFATSGGAGIKPSINGVPPIYVLPAGGTLFETLLLNHVLPQFRPPLAVAGDPGPLWAGDGVIEEKGERARVGFVESLTWAPRRVRLWPGDGGRCSRCGRQRDVLVRRMVFAQGLSRPKAMPVWEDPWAAYRLKQKAAQPIPVRPQEGKEIWRDFSPLFLAKKDRPAGARALAAIRPAILQQIDFLLSEGLLPAETPLRFETFALRTDMKMKFFEWHQHRFDFPPALLRGDAAGTVEDAIGLAEEAARCLARSLRQLHPVAERRSADPKAIMAALACTISRAGLAYWLSLELTFRRLIADPRLRSDLAAQADWLAEWGDAVREAASAVFQSTLEAGGFDADADALRRQETARRYFYLGLAALRRKGGVARIGSQQTVDEEDETEENADDELD